MARKRGNVRGERMARACPPVQPAAFRHSQPAPSGRRRRVVDFASASPFFPASRSRQWLGWLRWPGCGPRVRASRVTVQGGGRYHRRQEPLDVKFPRSPSRRLVVQRRDRHGRRVAGAPVRMNPGACRPLGRRARGARRHLEDPRPRRSGLTQLRTAVGTAVRALAGGPPDACFGLGLFPTRPACHRRSCSARASRPRP